MQGRLIESIQLVEDSRPFARWRHFTTTTTQNPSGFFFLVQISLGVLNEYCYVITYEKLLKLFLLFFYNKKPLCPK